MVTYICDKCGERIYKVNMTTMTLEIKEDNETVGIEEHHFCPECIKSFFNWEEDEER